MGFVPTLKSYMYTRVLPLLMPRSEVIAVYPEGKTQTPILTVCDQMTWQDISNEHAAVSVTPHNWQRAFGCGQTFKLFLCEAAWKGAVGATWRAQVYKDGRVFYENRRELLKLLDKCKAEKIPTVFWAKEDPAFFQNATYDFTDTALRFDYILTTAEECIAKYHALGHKQVYLWSFGFSPNLYYPPSGKDGGGRENIAVFAGSWYADLPERCNDLLIIFDRVLESKISLRIYDRYRNNGRSSKPFPEKYQPYVEDYIASKALGEVYRNVQYAINVNTVCDSTTMFARRVYEAMSCGAIVVSNPSIGMHKQFGNNVWFVDEGFDFKNIEMIRQNNIETVFAQHTWGKRMSQLFTLVGCERDQ